MLKHLQFLKAMNCFGRKSKEAAAIGHGNHVMSKVNFYIKAHKRWQSVLNIHPVCLKNSDLSKMQTSILFSNVFCSIKVYWQNLVNSPVGTFKALWVGHAVWLLKKLCYKYCSTKGSWAFCIFIGHSYLR